METRRRLKRKKSGLNSSIVVPTDPETKTEDPPPPQPPQPEFVARTPEQDEEREAELRLEVDQHWDESPPVLYSQAPNQEVYWDDNTPQMRKYRARLRHGLREQSDEEISPIKFLCKDNSTPTHDKTPTQKPHLASLPKHDLIKAQETLNGIQEFNKLFAKRKKEERESVIDKMLTPVVPADNGLTSSDDLLLSDIKPSGSKLNEGNTTLDQFSDDDSLLIQCTQETESLFFGGQLNKPEVKETETLPTKASQSDFDAFDSDESFDMLLSQIDEEELTVPSEERENKENENTWKNSESKAEEVPSSSRTIKKVRSSDDGINRTRSREQSSYSGGNKATAGSLRRSSSDNNIKTYCGSGTSDEMKPLRCTQEEIEEKRLLAKRKRQLSQINK